MLKCGNVKQKQKEASRSLTYKELWPQPSYSGGENELDEYVLVPHFRETFSDAFAEALEKAELDHERKSTLLALLHCLLLFFFKSFNIELQKATIIRRRRRKRKRRYYLLPEWLAQESNSNQITKIHT